MSDVPAPRVIVQTGSASHTLEPGAAAVTIGRDPAADVRIDDSRISRLHLRVESADGTWRVIDTSMNGMFFETERIPMLIIDRPVTVRLANPLDGPTVTFGLVEHPEPSGVEQPRQPEPEPDDGSDVTGTWELDEIDPGVVSAGAAAAARRRRLDISQRSLAADGIINAGALIAFEKGRSWPRERTRAKLEQVLRWPEGTISRIRAGAPAPADDVTQVLSNDEEVPLLVQAVVAAVDGCNLAIAALPAVDAPEFPARLTPILADLRRLEAVAVRALGIGRVTPALTRALSAIRRSYDQLMMLGATAPGAPLGQRLYAARRQANLSVPETAQAGVVSEDVISRVEAGEAVSDTDAEMVEALISQISWG